jgi:hypothetical protein
MPTFSSWSGCHDSCIVDNVVSLMDRGYTCYLEYEVELGGRKKVVIDIYAKREEKEVVIEVGYLSQSHGDRIEALKALFPKATIIHVHQWKNYFSVYDCDEEYIRQRVMRYAWQKDREMYLLLSKNAIDVRCALHAAARGVKWCDVNNEMGDSLVKNL